MFLHVKWRLHHLTSKSRCVYQAFEIVLQTLPILPDKSNIHINFFIISFSKSIHHPNFQNFVTQHQPAQRRMVKKKRRREVLGAAQKQLDNSAGVCQPGQQPWVSLCRYVREIRLSGGRRHPRDWAPWYHSPPPLPFSPLANSIHSPPQDSQLPIPPLSLFAENPFFFSLLSLSPPPPPSSRLRANARCRDKRPALRFFVPTASKRAIGSFYENYGIVVVVNHPYGSRWTSLHHRLIKQPGVMS